MRKITKLIIHCSASDKLEDDSVAAIKRLHTSNKFEQIKWGEYLTTGKGFYDIGYHFVISKDGIIHSGRDIKRSGAHCFGHNQESIGICINGNVNFSQIQKQSARFLIEHLLREFHLSWDDVFAHYALNKNKTCPNMTINELRNEGFQDIYS